MSYSSGTSNNDSLAKYIRHIRQLPMLEATEEYELAKKWRETGDRKSVDKLVESHLKLVAKIASGYRGYGLPVSDLIAEGNLGMMHAMKHYDPERGFRLSTYAMWWIKANIQEYILHSWSLVKIGTTAAQKKLFFNLRRIKKEIGKYDDHDLTPEMVQSIAEQLSVKEDEVKQMNYRLSSQDYSLNASRKTEEENSTEWIEWLVDESDNQEIQTIHLDEIRKRRLLLENAMKCLTKREINILVDRRLLDPPLTLETIAAKHNLSRERIRQIEASAFIKLQKNIKKSTPSRHEEI